MTIWCRLSMSGPKHLGKNLLFFVHKRILNRWCVASCVTRPNFRSWRRRIEHFYCLYWLISHIFYTHIYLHIQHGIGEEHFFAASLSTSMISKNQEKLFISAFRITTFVSLVYKYDPRKELNFEFEGEKCKLFLLFFRKVFRWNK